MGASLVEPDHWLHALPFQHASRRHVEILKNDIADAQEHPSCGDRAGGTVKQYSHVGHGLCLYHLVA